MDTHAAGVSMKFQNWWTGRDFRRRSSRLICRAQIFTGRLDVRQASVVKKSRLYNNFNNI